MTNAQLFIEVGIHINQDSNSTMQNEVIPLRCNQKHSKKVPH